MDAFDPFGRGSCPGPFVLAGILLGDVKQNLKLNKAITVWEIVSHRLERVDILRCLRWSWLPKIDLRPDL